MMKNDGQGHMYKYCDWCGKYCGTGGVNSWNHNFCSERCKRAYDKEHGTVDGGYKSGLVGHGIHNVIKKIGKFLGILFAIIFGGALVLELLSHLLNK